MHTFDPMHEYGTEYLTFRGKKKKGGGLVKRQRQQNTCLIFLSRYCLVFMLFSLYQYSMIIYKKKERKKGTCFGMTLRLLINCHIIHLSFVHHQH